MPVPLLICAMLLPIGSYLCVLGMMHASGRAWVTTGVRDYLALTLAVSGLVMAGPIRVVLHSQLVPLFWSHSIWVAPLTYALIVTALLPRGYEVLVVYNADEARVSGVVGRLLQQFGVPFRQVPGGWILPERSLRLELESFAPLSNVVIRFRGVLDRQLFVQLYEGLGSELAAGVHNWSVPGMTLGAAGIAALALPVWVLASCPVDFVSLLRQAVSPA